MDKQMDEFLATGMKKYKQASATMVSFGREVERRLHAILLTRQDWGRFLPEGAKLAKSTKYWSEYPFLNAKLNGTVGSIAVKVMIAVNWCDSESDYPFFLVTLEPIDPYRKAMAGFNWSDVAKWNHDYDRLELEVDEDDFALERDFGILLNEFVRCLNALPS